MDVRLDLRIAGKYRLGRKIGGVESMVFLGTNVRTGGEVSIKLESIEAKLPQLLYEAKVCKLLQGCAGVPRVHWYGVESDYNVMVVDMLGPTLQELFNKEGKFSLKTVLLLADQMLHMVDDVHAQNFIHRNINPDCFLMGLGEKENKLHIIGFNLAKKFWDSKSEKHIPYKEGKSIERIPYHFEYVSANTHRGMEQSRRDDMESVGYVLMYLLRGNLPWQGLDGDEFDTVKQAKLETSTQSLCHGSPSAFFKYLDHCRKLEFDSEPDYEYLAKIFREAAKKEAYEYDYIFDWTIVKSPNDKICVVCSDGIQEGFHGNRELPCGHVFHEACISLWWRLQKGGNCPACMLQTGDRKEKVKR